MGIFKNVVLRVATSFSIQIFFIGLTDVWTRWKHDFWIGRRFLTWTGGGFWRKNRKKHFFALYARVQNRSEKPRFSQSRCRKLTERGGCVLCFHVAVHRGLISILWWIPGFGENDFNYFLHIFAYFHQFSCVTGRWSPAQPWRASKADLLSFQVARGVTYKHTQKQQSVVCLGVW